MFQRTLTSSVRRSNYCGGRRRCRRAPGQLIERCRGCYLVRNSYWVVCSPRFLKSTRSHHIKRFNMRLSSRPTAVCVAASLCLAATTTEAFFAPSAALRGAQLARGQRATCSRCVGPAAVKMASMKGDALNPSQPDIPRRATFVSTAGGLFARRRGTAPSPNASEGDVTGPGEVARGGHRQRRAREVARRGFAAVATAVIVRSAFRAQPASAIMPKLRGTSAQQQVRAMYACRITRFPRD